jgi:uncharacterized integral membrane protein
LGRIIRWIIGLPLALLVIAFAVANRQAVVLSLDPLTPSDPFASITLPLWLLFFLGLLAGAVVGWAACWLAQGKHRKRARDAQGEISRLLAENEKLAQKTDSDADRNIVPVTSLGSGWI